MRKTGRSFPMLRQSQAFCSPKARSPAGRCGIFSAPLDRLPLQVGVALSAGEHGILQKNSLVTLAFMGILSFLFLSLFYSLVRSIIARLRRYGDDMERIAGDNFHGALAVDRRDEIGTIGEQFNRVLNRMRVLMRENIQKETAYKDAQLKALLLQINPTSSTTPWTCSRESLHWTGNMRWRTPCATLPR
mgnify:CR=1 FL=1